MARGYPGQFGRAVNTPWIWVGLSVLFLLPFLRGPPRMLHLDLAVLLAFGVSYAFFNAAEIGISVPTVYPLLAYLLARMLWIARRPPDGPGRLLLSDGALLAGPVLPRRRPGRAQPGRQRDRRRRGERDRRRAPARGRAALRRHVTRTTSRTGTRTARSPTRPTRRSSCCCRTGRPGHAAALAFDLGCIALLWRLGGLLPAYLWAAFPFTLLVSASGANDALVPLLVMLALLAWRRPAARGALRRAGRAGQARPAGARAAARRPPARPR